MNLTQVKENNAAEAQKFAEFLNFMPKVILTYALSAAIKRAVKPDKGNYHPYGFKGNPKFKKSSVSSDLIVHDSSNAAFNWRTTYSNAGPYLERRGRGIGSADVGDKFDLRGSTSRGDAYATGKVRHDLELHKLYTTFFDGNTKGLAKKVKLYNPIDGEYAKNANLDATMIPIDNSAVKGGKIGEWHLLSSMSSGVSKSPNIKALKNQVKQDFGNL